MSTVRFIVYEASTGTIIRSGMCPADMLEAQATKPEHAVMIVEALEYGMDVLQWVNPETGQLEAIPDRPENLLKLDTALRTSREDRKSQLKRSIRENPAAVLELIDQLIDRGVID